MLRYYTQTGKSCPCSGVRRQRDNSYKFFVCRVSRTILLYGRDDCRERGRRTISHNSAGSDNTKKKTIHSDYINILLIIKIRIVLENQTKNRSHIYKK